MYKFKKPNAEQAFWLFLVGIVIFAVISMWLPSGNSTTCWDARIGMEQC